MASTSATVAREAPVATNCDICIEKFNKTTQKQIKCPYCAYTSCSACTRQYLLQSKDDAHCMSCRRLWGRDILIDMFPMSFLNNDYKKHREEILFDQEKSLLPEAQPRVQQLRTLRVLEIEQSKLREIYNQKATEILEIKIKMDENFRLQRVYKSPNSLNYFTPSAPSSEVARPTIAVDSWAQIGSVGRATPLPVTNATKSLENRKMCLIRATRTMLSPPR